MEQYDYPVFLEGERVLLCPLDRDDASLYQRWLNRREVTDFLMLFGPITLEQELAHLDQRLRGDPEKDMVIGIRLRESGRLIGNIGLYHINFRDGHAEMGIFIGDEENMSQGYGTEAMRLLIRYAFDVLNMRKIRLSTYDFNLRAQKAYRKIGFKEVGRLRENKYKRGRYADELIMEVFRSEFIEEDEGPGRAGPA